LGLSFSICSLCFCHLHHIINISEAFKETVKKFGDVDIVINNAGIFNEKQWKCAVSVNVVSSKQKVLERTTPPTFLVLCNSTNINLNKFV
jgi:15-hydroxyprostaglandin dehydrogenase (NAD)